MSYERPEDKWKRENQYPPQNPGQAGPPPVNPADEARWMQEKQGRVAPRPGQPGPGQPPNPQEQQWLREKQGPPPDQEHTQVHQWVYEIPAPPDQEHTQVHQWVHEKQGQGQPPPPTDATQVHQWDATQVHQWDATQLHQWGDATQLHQWDATQVHQPLLGEKQGGPPPNPQEQQWLREKQGQAPAGRNPQEQQWLREKQGQGGPPPTQHMPGVNRPLNPQEQQWLRQNQGGRAPVVTLSPPVQVKKSRVGLYVGLGIGIVILVAAIAVLAIIILSPKSGPATATAINAANPTTAPAITAATVNPVTTVAPTTVAATTSAPTNVAATTASPTTPAAAVATTTAASGDSARLVSLADEAAKNSRWDEVIQSLEQLSTSDPNYSKAKPLLVKAYFESGQQEVAKGTNTQDSANKALNFYRKASAIDPNYADLADALRRADTYARGLLQYESEQYAQVVATLKPLYDEGELEKEGSHYRNSADLLYNSYIKLGDATFNITNQQDLLKSRAQYAMALTLDVLNKDEANSKLQQADRAVKLLGPTPTVKK